MRHSLQARSNVILLHWYILCVVFAKHFISSANALEVVAGSNCTSHCLSSLTAYSTNGSDVACHDSDYNTTVSGGTFQECVSCELESQAIDSQPDQSNLGWAFCERYDHYSSIEDI